MKKSLSLILGLALTTLLVPIEKANAYSSQVGVDPAGATPGFTGNEIETKSIVKSLTAGSSEALIAGLVVSYDTTAKDGYTVTRAVPQTEAGQNLLACATIVTYATTDAGYRPCITKGFALLRYNADTYPIVAGKHACVNASGVVRGCNLANATEATANTGLLPLESKSSGNGSDLHVLINLQ